jgi:hypothetical protein
MRLIPVAKGVATYIPVLYKVMAKWRAGGTGGTDTARACALWLTPGGWMSHQIDFTSHHLAKEWNGHWTYPDWLWKIIMGKQSFHLNQQPCSHHLQLLRASEFEVVCHLKQTGGNGIKRSQLALGWRGLSEDDFTCAGTFIQARKP